MLGLGLVKTTGLALRIGQARGAGRCGHMTNWVRPSERFLDPPQAPPPINFVHN